MADTRHCGIRINPELEQRARNAAPELADVNLSTLIRAGLFYLAEHPIPEAVQLASERKGPKGRKVQPA